MSAEYRNEARLRILYLGHSQLFHNPWGRLLPFSIHQQTTTNAKEYPMTETNTHSQRHDPDEAIRLRILGRAKTLNAEILARLSTAQDDLEAGQHRAALGALDGIEAQINIIRSVLLLLQ